MTLIRHQWDVRVENIALNLQQEHSYPYHSLLQGNLTTSEHTRNVVSATFGYERYTDLSSVSVLKVRMHIQ